MIRRRPALLPELRLAGHRPSNRELWRLGWNDEGGSTRDWGIEKGASYPNCSRAAFHSIRPLLLVVVRHGLVFPATR